MAGTEDTRTRRGSTLELSQEFVNPSQVLEGCGLWMKEGLRGGRAVPSGEIDPHSEVQRSVLGLTPLKNGSLRLTCLTTDFKFKVYSWINLTLHSQ